MANQCEHYPKHSNNQYGNCRGSVNRCTDHKRGDPPHNHWLCERHYSVLDHMREIGEK